MPAMGSSCVHVRGLFAPLSCEHFVSEYWERRHHLVRSAGVNQTMALPQGFSNVLRSEDVAHMATHWNFLVGLDHSQARMLRPNSFGHNDEWPDGTKLDATTIEAAHRTNHTVVMHNLELYWRPIGHISLALNTHFGLYSQANVYFSPGTRPPLQVAVAPQSRCFLTCQFRFTVSPWPLLSPTAAPRPLQPELLRQCTHTRTLNLCSWFNARAPSAGSSFRLHNDGGFATTSEVRLVTWLLRASCKNRSTT